eukprot:evm.model.scf_624.8 EVM.evm.TU.scf_624.8   scf_624:62755-64342(+)
MSKSPPLNIKRLVDSNQKYEDAERYSKTCQTGSLVSGWHERNFQRSGTGLQAAGKPLDLKGVSRDAWKIQRNPVCARDSVEQELFMADDAVKRERKARLRELFDREALEVEAELNSMGLALAKNRD